MLSISDWISYLSSEKNPNIGNIISIGALVLAAFATVMTVTTNTWPSIISAALIGLALAIYFWRFGQLYGRRAKIAEKLLDDIMSGKESDLSKIKERWEKEALGRKKAED
jgi:membrane protein implicated in regulation of membrane protease activity